MTSIPKAERRRKVCVVVTFGGLCLLLKRSPRWGSEWQPVTGHVDEGESFQEAARREVAEETGFSEGEVAPLVHAVEFEARGARFVEESFAFRLPHRAASEGHPPDPVLSFEHVDFAWLPGQDAVERVRHAGQREAILRALDPESVAS